MPRLVRPFRKRVTADHRLGRAGNVQLKRQILARLEGDQRLVVVRRQVKRKDVLALANFPLNGELAVTVPGLAGLLGLLALRGSDTRTTVPLPSRDRSRIDPPCKLASDRAIARPNPDP